MGAKPCPRCGLINPDRALRCDCGHVFVRRSAAEEAEAREELRETLSSRKVNGWILIGCGLLSIAASVLVAVVARFGFVLFLPSFGVIAAGARAITRANAGLAALGPPPEPPPPARLLR